MNQRLISLDVFRGMTVFFMIIVNSSGNWTTTFAPLLHAQWHGFTPTDLVFPAFLFAVGASIAIVMVRWKKEKTTAEVYRKVLRRTFVIFAIGFLLYWFPFVDLQPEGGIAPRPLGQTRIMGVLQRIALSYGISALLLYHLPLRKAIYLTVALLLGYWLVLLGFGDLTMEGNAAHRLDLFLLGPNHLYQGEGVPFDPEGLFSTLPCVGNVVAGYATVFYLRRAKAPLRVLVRLLLWGAGLVALGCIWHYAFPINKKLWTSSYVLLTSGICILWLGALYYWLDHEKSEARWPAWFTPMGKNPLFIYILSAVGTTLLYWVPHAAHGNLYSAIYQTVFRPAGDYTGAFFFALTWTMICWAVALWMDRQRIYIRV